MRDRFIILEWVGRWVISDGHHGGIKAGPYTYYSDAYKALHNYAERIYIGCLQNDQSQSEAQTEHDLIIKRHYILRCEFPPDLPE